MVHRVFLLASDSFISIFSSLDTTGKRDSSDPSGIGKGTFSSQTEPHRCTLSDNSTSSVSVRGICESINVPWSPWAVFLLYHLWKLAIRMVNFRHFAEENNLRWGKYL